MLLLYAIPIGMLAGLAIGGRLAPLATIRIRLWPFALGGLAFQLLLFSPPVASVVGPLGPALFVGSSLVVLAVLRVNLVQPGFVVIYLGALLNLAVILVNGGQMPTTAEAMLAAHGVAAVPTPHFSNSVIVDGAQLLFLGDIFALPRPLPLANVFSIGDVVIALGGASFLVQAMRNPIGLGQRPLVIRSFPPAPRTVRG